MPPPYSAGSVFLQVVPSFAGVQEEIGRHAERYGKAFGEKFDKGFADATKDGLGDGVEEGLERAGRKARTAGEKSGREYARGVGESVGKEAGKEIGRALDRTGQDASRAGEKAGRDYAGKFASTLARQVAQMQKQIKAVRIGVDDTEALAGFERIRLAADTLQKAKIGVDLDAEQAAATVHEMEKILDRMSEESVSIRTKVDLDQAARDAAVVRKMIETVIGQDDVKVKTSVEMPANIGAKELEAGRRGPLAALAERQLGAFERTFRASIDKALRDMPALEISIDDEQLKTDVDNVRNELQNLRGMRLGTDLSTDEALTRLRALMDAVNEIDGKTADVRVRSDAATAYKELRATFDLVERLEKEDATVNVRVSGAGTAASQLRQVNREAANSSHNGQDAANAFRAFNGRILAFVTLAPAAIPLLGALAGGLAAIGPAALAGIAGIGTAALGFSGIGDAVGALNDVQDTAVQGAAQRARTMRGAARGVRDAEQSLARAREDGAEAISDANRRVADAEENLADAQRDARQAQLDLVDARAEGGRQLEDLALRARGGALAERAAALELAQAQAEYIAIFNDGASTNVDKESAAIALERAKLAYDEAIVSNKRLQKEQTKASKEGVEGTEAYQSALENVADANDKVVDAQEGVTDAQRDAARTQRDSAQSIADAQQGLIDAQEDYQAALTQTEDVGSASMQRLNSAMAALGPAGREFAEYLHGLRPYFRELRAEAQEGFLPGLQSWMETITGHYGPALQRTVGNISSAVGDVFAMFGQELLTDPWAEFFDMMENDAPRWIRDLGEGTTNLGTGFAELFVAAKPFTDLFLGYFKDLTADFKDWAATVGGSQGFREFFDYVKRIAPEVGEFLQQLGRALINLLVALAPYGEAILNVLTGLLEWVGDMDPAALGAIATAILGLVTAMQTIFGLTSLVKSAEAAWRLATGSFGGFASKIPVFIGGLAALAIGIGVLYVNSEDFRELVDDVVGGIADLIGWVTKAVGPVGALGVAIATWIIAKQAVGWIAALRNPTSQLASASSMLGANFGDATGKVGGFKNAMSGAMGVLGGPWGIALAAGALLIGGVSKSLNDATAQTDKWAQALLEGGKAADTARRQYEAERNSEPFEWMADLDEFTGMHASLDEAREKAQALREEMTPLEAAQNDVEWATNNLADAQDRYGTESDEAKLASQQLRSAQGALADKQGALEDATREATDALSEQATMLLAASSSNLAMNQAQLAATRAQKRYNEVMADANATAEDRAEAENELHGAYLQVAAAALRQAEDQAKLRGETLDGVDGAKAQLDALVALRDEMGGNVPDAIATLIEDLEATAGTAANVSAAVDGVTGSVQGIPGEKSVTVTALTDDAKQLLEDLGIKVTTFPDGHTELIANTDAAQTILDNFIAEAEKRDIVLPVKPGFYQQFLDDMLNGPVPNPNGGSPSGGSFSGPGGMWVPAVPKATGGAIVGPGTGTSDEVPIWASNGEFMIRSAIVDRLGLPFFEWLNAGKFATGGLVGAAPSIPSWNPTAAFVSTDTTPLAKAWAETLEGLGSATGVAAPLLAAIWNALRDNAVGSVDQLRTESTKTLTGMFSDLNRETDQSLSITEQRFRDMDTTVGEVVSGTRDNVGTVWAGLRNATGEPVNFVISNVLNAGLFAALNSVASTFGLKKTIPNATPVALPRYATGGRVGGSSPSKGADNILARLTANEFVQPVDTVDYYGVDFMEAIRQRRIPREILPGYATGGLVGTWPQLNAIRGRLFPSTVLTSAYRPGANDWHGAGNAIDIGVPGNVVSQLAAVARRIALLFPQSTELINNPGGSIKNGHPVPPSFWGASTWAAHANHVHWAMTAAALASGAMGSTDVPTGLDSSVSGPIAEMFSTFGRNMFTEMLGAIPDALSTGVWTALSEGDADGGQIAATLYDDGGYLPPGLSMVLNATGKPEPVLTADELELLRGGGGGGRGPLIGALHLPMVANDPHEAMDEVVHQLSVLDTGGRYGEDD